MLCFSMHSPIDEIFWWNSQKTLKSNLGTGYECYEKIFVSAEPCFQKFSIVWHYCLEGGEILV